MCKLSIIIPVYFNADTLEPLYYDLKEKVLTKLSDYEIIFVDDGSTDNSYEIIQQLAKEDCNVKSIKLSRNFGEHAAILAGLLNCSGDCAITKQADMQEDSELILTMFDKYKEGNKVVIAARKERKEKLHIKFFANIYYWLIRKTTFNNMPKGGFDCFLIDRQVIEILRNLDEKNSSLTLQILWVGFTPAIVNFTRKERIAGKSKWTLKKKAKLVVDSLTSFSSYPIKLVSYIGFLSFIFSTLAGIYFIFDQLAYSKNIIGWTSTIVIILMAFGIIMLTLGILGEYIWRILEDTRKRPTYIIDEDSSQKNKNENLKIQ